MTDACDGMRAKKSWDRRILLTQEGPLRHVPKMPEPPIEDKEYVLRHESKQLSAWVVKLAGGATTVGALLVWGYRSLKG